MDVLPSGPIAVALSGGLDSTTLMHALCCMPEVRERGVRAIHIDHDLHPSSADWANHCQLVCQALSVPLLTVKVSVEHRSGLGLEAAARQVRYAAFKAALSNDEILALAQHGDDQSETVLLKLLRGAGPEGLGGMRSLRRLNKSWAWRPLLDTPRDALRDYAKQVELEWIEDPSNTDIHFERNFLRHDILPPLRKRWPKADQSISQSARWIQAAANFIDDQAQVALTSLQGFDPATLDCDRWLALPDALRDPVLRRWLRHLKLPEPNQHQVGELARQLSNAGESKLPCVRWPGAEVRRYRDLIYAMPTLKMPPADWQARWDGEPLGLPAGLGSLVLVTNLQAATALASPDHLTVRFRRGGERLRLNDAGYHRDLRDMYQEAGIPPWQRGRMPMVLNSAGALLSVGDLWISDIGQHEFARLNRAPRWQRE